MDFNPHESMYISINYGQRLLINKKINRPKAAYEEPHHAVYVPCFDPAWAGGYPPRNITVPHGRSATTRVRIPEYNLLAQNCDTTRTQQGLSLSIL